MIKLGQGSVYPALRAMESEGLIERLDGPKAERDVAGHPPAFYRITSLGRQTAREQREAAAGIFRLPSPLGMTNLRTDMLRARFSRTWFSRRKVLP